MTKIDSSGIFNHLVEEIGEVVRELMMGDNKENISEKLAYVLFLVFKLVKKLDINIEKVFIRKFELIKR